MFDIQKIIDNRKKASSHIAGSKLVHFILHNMLERIFALGNVFSNSLVISPNHDFVLKYLKNYKSNDIDLTKKISFDSMSLHDEISLKSSDVKSNSFDLIMLPFGLYYQNNIEEFLYYIHQLLKDNGVVICNMPRRRFSY